MILADTCVWIDHFRRGDPHLCSLLAAGLIATHPLVLGELALGELKPRASVIADLRRLRRSPMANEDAFFHGLEALELAGTGLGPVGAHLLIACKREHGLRLWTRDRRLGEHARRLGLAWAPST